MNLSMETCLTTRIILDCDMRLVIVSEDAADNSDGSDGPFSGAGARSDDWPPLDTLLSLLAERHTRYVLSYFESESARVATLDDLVDRVVEREAAEGLADDSEDRRRRVAIALHHKRLPELDDAAVADYDPRSKTVRYWGDDELADRLEAFEDL